MRRIRGAVPELTWMQLLELICGTEGGSNFGSEEERREA